jgi:hypothetical protein
MVPEHTLPEAVTREATNQNPVVAGGVIPVKTSLKTHPSLQSTFSSF